MIHVYTGNGKGKTTAALGLALRAAGNGLKVYIGQFLKGRAYGELRALKKFKNIKIEQFGSVCFVGKKPSQKDVELAKKGLEKSRKILSKKIYDLVVLDEINVALRLGLLDLEEVLAMIRKIPKKTELVLTGRYAPKKIIKAADLVSEIKEIKHYFKKGVKCRRGIEF